MIQNDIIATWVYLDSEGEESFFPQVRYKSSSEKAQRVFWQCIVVFFSSSLRFHSDKRHILFTNAKELPSIKRFSVEKFCEEKRIEVIRIENKFKVPSGYYGSWNNQFYEFSILDFMTGWKDDFQLMLLDSDCIFTTSVDPLFQDLRKSPSSAFTSVINYSVDHKINGLNRRGMGEIFGDLGLKDETTPCYSGGEFLFVKKSFVCELMDDFPAVWDDQLRRFKGKRIKFNEEAHLLSYYYYKLNAGIGRCNQSIKRCWTNPFIFSNVTRHDCVIPILHLPNEKRFGFKKIFKTIARGRKLTDISSENYQKKIVGYMLSIKLFYYLYLIYKPLKRIIGKGKR